jgi:restriction endonuclease Mrr
MDELNPLEAYRIASLIIDSKLTGLQSLPKELIDWAEEHPDNKKLLNNLMSPDYLMEDLRDYSIPEADKEAAFENIWKHFRLKAQLEASTVIIYDLPPVDEGLCNHLLEHPKMISYITWREFEYFIRSILEELEYEVELQQGSKDGGIDLIAVRKEDTFGLHRYLIQAKHQKQKVRVEPVQRLAFLVDDLKATKGCLITTSTFTKGAINLAQRYSGIIELKDYNELMHWIDLVNATKRKLD